MTSAFEKPCGAGKPLKAEPPHAKEFAGLEVRPRDALGSPPPAQYREQLFATEIPV